MHVNIITEGLLNREHLLLLYLHNTKITYRCVHCINSKSILYDINIFLKLKLFHSDHAIKVPHNIPSTYKTTDVSECTSIRNELFLSTFIFFKEMFCYRKVHLDIVCISITQYFIEKVMVCQ